jgi:S-adenosylmethionine decarboxylase
MFVWPHKIILKTCGTTSLLLGLEELLKIAKDECDLSSDVYRVFYSHTTFKFPKQQSAPHTAWHLETAFLDKIFGPSYLPSLIKILFALLFSIPCWNKSVNNLQLLPVFLLY